MINEISEETFDESSLIGILGSNGTIIDNNNYTETHINANTTHIHQKTPAIHTSTLNHLCPKQTILPFLHPFLHPFSFYSTKKSEKKNAKNVKKNVDRSSFRPLFFVNSNPFPLFFLNIPPLWHLGETVQKMLKKCKQKRSKKKRLTHNRVSFRPIFLLCEFEPKKNLLVTLPPLPCWHPEKNNYRGGERGGVITHAFNKITFFFLKKYGRFLAPKKYKQTKKQPKSWIGSNSSRNAILNAAQQNNTSVVNNNNINTTGLSKTHKQKIKAEQKAKQRQLEKTRAKRYRETHFSRDKTTTFPPKSHKKMTFFFICKKTSLHPFSPTNCFVFEFSRGKYCIFCKQKFWKKYTTNVRSDTQEIHYRPHKPLLSGPKL